MWTSQIQKPLLFCIKKICLVMKCVSDDASCRWSSSHIWVLSRKPRRTVCGKWTNKVTMSPHTHTIYITFFFVLFQTRGWSNPIWQYLWSLSVSINMTCFSVRLYMTLKCLQTIRWVCFFCNIIAKMQVKNIIYILRIWLESFEWAWKNSANKNDALIFVCDTLLDRNHLR